MRCVFCGCTDSNPCIVDGTPCGWVEGSLVGPLCTACEDVALAMVDAPASDDEALDESRLVELVTEAQANAYLRAHARGGLMAKNPSLAGILQALGRAEKKLKKEFWLRLQLDGSGSVVDFEENPIFHFSRREELIEWLKNPRVVEYDDEGSTIVPAEATV